MPRARAAISSLTITLLIVCLSLGGISAEGQRRTRGALKRDGINYEGIEPIAGEAAMTVPVVERYFTRTRLQQGTIPPNDTVARRACFTAFTQSVAVRSSLSISRTKLKR